MQLFAALMGKKKHLTYTVLPVGEWEQGRTLCNRKGKLWRLVALSSTLHPLCSQCRSASMKNVAKVPK